MNVKVNGVIMLSVLLSLSNCGSDDDSNSGGESKNLGTFVGYLQVTDDPQTDLGYVHNVSVTVIRNGSTATVQVVGNDDFEREYTGNVTFETATSFDMFILKQTKPVEKIAGDRLVIVNNELTIDISLANDMVTVRESLAEPPVQIAGKIRMIGTELLRQ